MSILRDCNIPDGVPVEVSESTNARQYWRGIHTDRIKDIARYESADDIPAVLSFRDVLEAVIMHRGEYDATVCANCESCWSDDDDATGVYVVVLDRNWQPESQAEFVKFAVDEVLDAMREHRADEGTLQHLVAAAQKALAGMIPTVEYPDGIPYEQR